MQKEKFNETGRSMVEMLGVLAIIGVLSVTGIASYSNAMNKHRANELLNAASKRAVVVAGQLLNNSTASLAEFSGQTVPGGTFTDGTITPSNGKFTLSITGVSEAICNHMKNSIGAVVQKFEPADCSETTITLTFNNDLRSESNTSNETTLGLAQNVPCGSGFCYEGQTCVDGEEWDGRLSCDGNWADEMGKCCKSKDDTSCPPGEILYNDGPDYTTCMSCPESGFVLETNGTLACCQKGTGQHWNPFSYNWDYPHPLMPLAFRNCCTEQGGFIGYVDNATCCRGNGYDLQGNINGLCCGEGAYLYGKKNGKFYGLYPPSDASCPDYTYGCVDVSEYAEWQCCAPYDSNSEYDTDKDFCDELREKGEEYS